MSCEDCQENLIDYYYGELAQADRTRIGSHLAGCRECALEFCRLHADLAGIASQFDEAPGDRVKQAMRKQVRAEFGESRWTRLIKLVARPIPAYQALGLVVIALVAAVLFAPAIRRTVSNSLEGRSTQTLVNHYDASKIVAVDPNTL